jgi:hypothetical protein
MERQQKISRNFARPTGKSVELGKLRKSQLNLKAVPGKLKKLIPRSMTNIIFLRTAKHVACLHSCVFLPILEIIFSGLVNLKRMLNAASNFVVPQLTEQDSGPYDKSHPDYVRRGKILLTWESVSHEILLDMCMFRLKLIMESRYRLGQVTQREVKNVCCLIEFAVKIYCKITKLINL